MSDLISRQAAIEAAVKMFEAWYGGSVLREREIRIVFDALPSAEPERQKGEWTRHILINANVPWGYDCTACGRWFVIGENTAKSYAFCPNCGADMRGNAEPQESEDKE